MTKDASIKNFPEKSALREFKFRFEGGIFGCVFDRPNVSKYSKGWARGMAEGAGRHGAEFGFP
jgi:hypothetical protein